MICPVRDKRSATLADQQITLEKAKCVKKECAWWIKSMVTVGKEFNKETGGTIVFEEDQGCCAVLLS